MFEFRNSGQIFFVTVLGFMTPPVPSIRRAHFHPHTQSTPPTHQDTAKAGPTWISSRLKQRTLPFVFSFFIGSTNSHMYHTYTREVGLPLFGGLTIVLAELAFYQSAPSFALIKLALWPPRKVLANFVLAELAECKIGLPHCTR